MYGHTTRNDNHREYVLFIHDWLVVLVRNKRWHICRDEYCGRKEISKKSGEHFQPFWRDPQSPPTPAEPCGTWPG